MVYLRAERHGQADGFAIPMILVSVLFLVFALASVVWGAESVKVGYVHVFDEAPTLVAQEADIFKKNGLSVNLTAFTSGTTLVKGLVAGTLDICVLGFTNVVAWGAQGAELVIVGKQQMGYHALVARNDRGISKLADIKGKTLATQQAGSTADITLKGVVLPSVGLQTGNLNLVYTDPTTALQSLLAGRVDAAFLFEPFATMAQLQGKVRVIHEVGESWPFPCMVVVASRKFATNKPQVLRSFLKSNKEAVELIQSKPGTAASLLAPLFVPQGVINGVNGPVEGRTVMEQALKTQTYDWRITQTDVQRMQQLAGVMQKQGVLSRSVDVAKLIDLSWQNGLTQQAR